MNFQMGIIKVEIKIPELVHALESFKENRVHALEVLSHEIRNGVGDFVNSLLQTEMDLYLGQAEQSANKRNGIREREYAIKGVVSNATEPQLQALNLNVVLRILGCVGTAVVGDDSGLHARRWQQINSLGGNSVSHQSDDFSFCNMKMKSPRQNLSRIPVEQDQQEHKSAVNRDPRPVHPPKQIFSPRLVQQHVRWFNHRARRLLLKRMV
ncbi:MAG: hypothetical protein IPJ84_03300 [Bdellovibrionales bacterium]|nr:hypothetical protein [Bdellovibrionales bacterium]